MPASHDTEEERENNGRRDDHLEREFGVTGRDFQRGSDRDNELFDRRFRQDAELFDARMSERRKLDDLEARRRERAEVQTDEVAALQFRDAQMHSTAVASLEGETATVGDEEQENVPDNDDANTGVAPNNTKTARG